MHLKVKIFVQFLYKREAIPDNEIRSIAFLNSDALPPDFIHLYWNFLFSLES